MERKSIKGTRTEHNLLASSPAKARLAQDILSLQKKPVKKATNR